MREYQQQLPFDAYDKERFLLLDNLRFLGRSTRSCHVRALVELVGRIAGEEELLWTVDGTPDARDCLCSRLNMTPRTMRRTIQDGEYCGALLVRRCRRADRSYDRLALRVNWRRLAARELVPLTDARVEREDGFADPAPVSGSEDDRTEAEPAPVSGSENGRTEANPAPVSGSEPVRPNWPHGVAKLAAPERPNCPVGVAKLAAQYKQDKQIPPPPPTPATATAADPRGDTERERWAAAAEIVQSTGFASWHRLLTDARRLQVTPEDLHEAARTYLAQPHRFRGPGALAFWVQNRRWPVDGVLPAEVAAEKSSTLSERSKSADDEKRAMRIVYAGRKARKNDETIRQELTAAGLAWE
jgi:hypothetical protein